MRVDNKIHIINIACLQQLKYYNNAYHAVKIYKGGGGVPVVLRHRNASDLRDIADEVIFFLDFRF